MKLLTSLIKKKDSCDYDELIPVENMKECVSYNLKHITVNIGFQHKDKIEEIGLAEYIEEVVTELPNVNRFTLECATLGLLNANNLNNKLSNVDKSKVKLPEIRVQEPLEDTPLSGNQDKFNMSIKKAKLCMVKGDMLLQTKFVNIKLKALRQCQIILHECKYVLVSNFESFDGILSVEEEKETESFLLELISKADLGSDSPYPPGFLYEYHILFELSDLDQITFTDAQVINDIADQTLKASMINERSEKPLEHFIAWEILNKLHPKTKVSLLIGKGMVLKDLDKFLDILAANYEYLNIIEIDCFYFMTEERISSLDKFFLSNRHIHNVRFKVSCEETLSSLIKVLFKHPILNIYIDYSGDLTETAGQMCKKFITLMLDRKIEVFCENTQEIISKKFVSFQSDDTINLDDFKDY